MLIYRVSFPDGGPRLGFAAESNAPGAAWCIDGYMNTRPGGTWVASLRSSATAAGDGDGDGGTRSTGLDRPTHCRWSLDPADLEGGATTTRVQRVEQLLRIMIVK